MFNSLKSTLKKGISVAAQVADTGIFEGVPIVSNVLCACSYINEQIEVSDAQDEKLTEVVLPKGLQMIESVAFINCKALKSLRVPKGCEITRDAFNDSGMKLKNVTWFDPVSGVDEEPEPVDPLEELVTKLEGTEWEWMDDGENVNGWIKLE